MDSKGWVPTRGAHLCLLAAMWQRKDTDGVVKVSEGTSHFTHQIYHELDQIDHGLDHLDPNCRYDVLCMIFIVSCRYNMLCRICAEQIRPRKYALDHADDTAAPIRQHELDRADEGEQGAKPFLHVGQLR